MNNFNSLLMEMQDDVFEAEIEFGILESDSIEAMESSDVMETLFLLEESGTLKYDAESSDVFININGMKPVSELYVYAIDILRDIKNNPEISNIFAKVGPPQDLSNKIHTDADARKAAKTFSEGRKSLENLLYFCFTNNIRTFTVCAGHKKNLGQFNDGYISFNLEDEFTRNCIKYLNGKPSIYESAIDVEENDDRSIIEKMGCDYETADAVFTEILGNLEEYIAKKDVISELYEDNGLNKRIDTMLEYKNNPTNGKIGFLDVIESGIKLSLEQKATHFVRTQIMEERNPNKNQGTIKE